jgi:hypothetical protein
MVGHEALSSSCGTAEMEGEETKFDELENSQPIYIANGDKECPGTAAKIVAETSFVEEISHMSDKSTQLSLPDSEVLHERPYIYCHQFL